MSTPKRAGWRRWLRNLFGARVGEAQNGAFSATPYDAPTHPGASGESNTERGHGWAPSLQLPSLTEQVTPIQSPVQPPEPAVPGSPTGPSQKVHRYKVLRFLEEEAHPFWWRWNATLETEWNWSPRVTLTIFRLPNTHVEARRERLIRMLRYAAILNHPLIEQVFELGLEGNHIFLVCESHGLHHPVATLWDLIKATRAQQSPLPIEVIYTIALQVCEAMLSAVETRITMEDAPDSPSYRSDQGSVPHSAEGTYPGSDGRHYTRSLGTYSAYAHCTHGSLNPTHIILPTQQEGAVDRLKLRNFGAAVLQWDAFFVQERYPVCCVAPAYWSPEHHTFPTPYVGDIFSWGTIVWELLCNQPLFAAPTPSASFQRVLQHPIPDLTSLRVDCPAPFAEVVHKALHRDLSQRFSSWDDLHAALTSLKHEPIRATELATHVTTLLEAPPRPLPTAQQPIPEDDTSWEDLPNTRRERALEQWRQESEDAIFT